MNKYFKLYDATTTYTAYSLQIKISFKVVFYGFENFNSFLEKQWYLITRLRHDVSACIRGEIKSDNKIYDAHQIANLI